MKKYIFIVGLILLTFVGCVKDDTKLEKKEDLLSVSYNQFEFKNFYDLVRNPISIDLLKRRLDAQKITYEPLEGYEKDIFFVVTDSSSVYHNYRIEIQAGNVLTNFENPTSKDVQQDYIQNVTIYPLDDNKEFITEKQTKEKYKGFFDTVKNSLSEIEPNYDSSFRIASIFGGGLREYDAFINGMNSNGGIAIWNKDIKEENGNVVPLTLDNISKENSLPKVVVDYQGPSSFLNISSIPYDSKYRIEITASLPKDIKKILF